MGAFPLNSAILHVPGKGCLASFRNRDANVCTRLSSTMRVRTKKERKEEKRLLSQRRRANSTDDRDEGEESKMRREKKVKKRENEVKHYRNEEVGISRLRARRTR